MRPVGQTPLMPSTSLVPGVIFPFPALRTSLLGTALPAFNAILHGPAAPLHRSSECGANPSGSCPESERGSGAAKACTKQGVVARDNGHAHLPAVAFALMQRPFRSLLGSPPAPRDGSAHATVIVFSERAVSVRLGYAPHWFGSTPVSGSLVITRQGDHPAQSPGQEWVLLAA